MVSKECYTNWLKLKCSGNICSDVQVEHIISDIAPFKQTGGVVPKVVLIRLGIYMFVNKARGVGAPNFLLILCDVTTIWEWNFYTCDVTTILSETQIIRNQSK